MRSKTNFSFRRILHLLAEKINHRAAFLLTILLPLVAYVQPLAKDHDKFLGCATSSELSRYLIKYWNQATPGNDGKWASVEPGQGYFTWSNLDKIYNYVISKNLLYKHHTLIWGNQQPGWLASLDTAGQRAAVENWIKLVGARYPKMNMVDVVNEPLHAQPVYKNALGGDGVTGWDWVIKSFQLARKYCASGVQLVLNEYNVLHDNAATTNYIDLITLLQNRGLIDAIGIQGHYFEFRSHTDAASNVYVYNINAIRSNLDRLAALGLPIYITEFDIDEASDANQLAQYKIYFPIFWHHRAVKGITFWGYIQGDVWSSHPYTYLLTAIGGERPAMQWLREFILLPPVPTLISPIGSTGGLRNPALKWRTADSAISYHVQVSVTNNFTTTEIDTTVSDTLLQLGVLQANKRYYWRVSAGNEHGTSEYSAFAAFQTGEIISAVLERQSLPFICALEQNYPNPFNPTTAIAFSLVEDRDVYLQIFDRLGREISTLIHERMSAGRHAFRFDAKDLQSGIYFYRIKAGDFIQTKRMTLLK